MVKLDREKRHPMAFFIKVRKTATYNDGIHLKMYKKWKVGEKKKIKIDVSAFHV